MFSGDVVLDSKIPDDAALEIDIHTTNNTTDDDSHNSQLFHKRDYLSDSDGSFIDEHSEAQTFVMVKLEIPDVEPGENNLDNTTTAKNLSSVKRKMSATSSERQEKARSTRGSVVEGFTKVANGFECMVCHRFLSSRTNLAYHSSTHTGLKPYSCDICGRKYPAKNELNRHLKRCGKQ